MNRDSLNIIEYYFRSLSIAVGLRSKSLWTLYSFFWTLCMYSFFWTLYMYSFVDIIFRVENRASWLRNPSVCRVHPVFCFFYNFKTSRLSLCSYIPVLYIGMYVVHDSSLCRKTERFSQMLLGNRNLRHNSSNYPTHIYIYNEFTRFCDNMELKVVFTYIYILKIKNSMYLVESSVLLHT